MLSNTPIRWISKLQKTVDTSTHGLESVATEHILEFRFILRSLRMPLDGPSLMLRHDMSVVWNTTIPSSFLKKKHNAIAYHRVREAIVAGKMSFSYFKM
jgi:hypothetical protein